MDVVNEKEDERKIVMLKAAIKEKAKWISDLTYLVEDVGVFQKSPWFFEEMWSKLWTMIAQNKKGSQFVKSHESESWNLKTWNTWPGKIFISSYLFADDCNG